MESSKLPTGTQLWGQRRILEILKRVQTKGAEEVDKKKDRPHPVRLD